MNLKLYFTTQTLQMLSQRRQLALKTGQSQLLKRLNALQMLADQLEPALIATRLGVAVSTVYAWLSSFMQHGSAALTYGPKKGRKAKLDQAQLETLKQKLLAGPLPAGFNTGLWNSAIIAELIKKEFGQSFHPHYLPSLLSKLGFSYQKARFESDHLDPVRRKEWLEQEWPEIVGLARQQKALLLFGDEASFAQWGSLHLGLARTTAGGSHQWRSQSAKGVWNVRLF